jgi:hypothetical protein
MAAGIAIGAACHTRCTDRFCPRQFRGTSFNQKVTRVVRANVLLSHPVDNPVSHINGIKSHVTTFSRPNYRGHSNNWVF